MSEYQPQKGDRVRVVLEGEVTKSTERSWHMDDYWVFSQRAGEKSVVSVERVAPPLPTTPESVLRYHGHTFLLHEDGFWRDGCDDQCQLGTAVTGDQVEVIFDAGAER